MEDWDKIIVLQLQLPKPRKLPVRDVKDAARLLLGKWPLKQGKSYRQAVLNCSAAIKGSLSQEMAQWSFMAAATEAAIPFEVQDRFETEIAAVCDALLAEGELGQGADARAGNPLTLDRSILWQRASIGGPSDVATGGPR